MKFFFDRCLSIHIARMLACYDRDNNFVHQDEDRRFEPTSTDVHIIQTLSSESPLPVWVTGDASQKRNPEERAALRDSGMTIFFFRNNGQPHHQALKALAVWPVIVERATNVRVPTAFSVPAGKIGHINAKVDRLGHTSELFRNA